MYTNKQFVNDFCELSGEALERVELDENTLEPRFYFSDGLGFYSINGVKASVKELLLGKELDDKVNDTFGTSTLPSYSIESLNWFYSPALALDNKTPYEVAKSGDLESIETLVGRIEHGVYC